MTCYLPIEQTILFLNAATDVVDDEVAFVVVVPVVRDDANVRHPFTVEVPCDDITGLIVRAVRGDSNRLAATSKKRLQVRNSPMIDVLVRGFQSPFLRIYREICRHVFVNFFLQIYARISKRANDNIGTRSGISRHVTSGIRKHTVVLSVVCRYLDLFVGALENAADRFGRYVVGRRPRKRLNRSVRTKRMVERRFAAAATEANDINDQEISRSHTAAQLRHDY